MGHRRRPGYGASPPASAGRQSVAQELVRTVDELGLETFSVVGMSVGGVHALELAATFPGRVSSVVTVSSPGQVAVMEPPEHRDGLSDVAVQRLLEISTGSAGDAAELLRPEFEEWVRALGADDPDDDALAARWAGGATGRDRELLLETPPEVRARSAREAVASTEGYLRDAVLMLRRWHFDVVEVQCPVLVRHGALDDSASVRNAQWLADNVPGATLSVDPGDGHLGALHDHWAEILRWPGAP